RVLARKLPAGAVAAIDGRGRHRKVRGTLIGFLAASLAGSEQDRLVGRLMELEELIFDDQAAAVLRCVGIGRSGVYKALVDRNHPRDSRQKSAVGIRVGATLSGRPKVNSIRGRQLV